MSFVEELKRRNVFRVAIAYVVLAWLMAQVADLLLDTFGAPDWVLKTLLAVILIGFPFAVFFAWAFELTPEGLKKEKDVDRSQSITPQTGRKLDFIIIGVLMLALGYFAWDKFLNTPAQVNPLTVATVDEVISAPAAPALPTDKSIAVLPFENRSKLADDEYFTGGIHDDLLTQLAQIASLRVISRTSVGQFKSTTLSIREIAEQLNVATVLEGGVQRAGNQVRINLQLIDAATDTHLWAQTFDRELTATNIFAIQSEIATAVTEALRATLSPEEKVRIAHVPTENMEALEEYFKGRAEMDLRTQPAIESAKNRFAHTVSLDPEFALALASQAEAILLLSSGLDSYGSTPRSETVALARPLIERALQLAPNDSLVLAINGLMLGYAYDFAAEAEYYDRSLAINPSSGEVMNWKRLSLQLAGKFRDAQEVSLHMLEVDPMSMVTLANGIGAKASGQTADAQELELLLQRLDSLDASYGLSARAYLARIHGNIPLAIRYHFQTAEADPGRTSNLRETADLLFGLGLADEGLAVAPDQLYEAAMYRGDWGQAVDLARQAYEKNPDLIEEMQRLMSALLRAGDVDEAFTIADKLWTEFGDYPSAMIDAMADMAWVAKKSEHPTEARKYRDGLATLAEALIDADISTYWSYSIYARLAVLDQRDNDAINALSRAIDTGARWPLLGQDPAFEDLHDNLDFQAQVSRMNELIEQERHEVLAMLCGPDTILSTWKPAPATCELYKGIAEGGS